jgi:hypothetical protein
MSLPPPVPSPNVLSAIAPPFDYTKKPIELEQNFDALDENRGARIDDGGSECIVGPWGMGTEVWTFDALFFRLCSDSFVLFIATVLCYLLIVAKSKMTGSKGEEQSIGCPDQIRSTQCRLCITPRDCLSLLWQEYHWDCC